MTDALAQKTPKYIAKINHEYNASQQPVEIINFSSNEDIKVDDNLTISKGANLTAQVLEFQKERRWHKSGFIVCKILSYEQNGEIIDVQDKDIHYTIRKYEKLNPKEAIIIGTELVVFTGASLFAPGVDVGYFFTKGAIQRQKHYNWFKAGVHNAYDNSIFWFGLKGKPIELSKNDEIKIKPLNKQKAHDISAKIEYRKHKARFKKEKAFVKAEIKEIKEEIKLEKKIEKQLAKSEKSGLKEKLSARHLNKIIKRRYKLEQKYARAKLKEEHRKLEEEITQIKYELRKEQKLARKNQKNVSIAAKKETTLENNIEQKQEIQTVELQTAGKILPQQYYEQPIDYLQQYYETLYN